MNKTELRKQTLLKRKQLNCEETETLSHKVFNNLKSTNILNFKNILAYSDFKNEVRTDEIINFLMDSGREVYLPKCDTLTLTFVPVKALKEKLHYNKNIYGISEPTVDNEKTELAKIDCVIVPGIVFDKKGNRIGFGCGYYDKYLNENPTAFKIGLCYEFQLTDCIETDDFDIPMDMIITEERTIFCDRENR